MTKTKMTKTEIPAENSFGAINLALTVESIEYEDAQANALPMLQAPAAEEKVFCRILAKINGRALLGVGQGENRDNAAYTAWEHLKNQVMDQAVKVLDTHPVAITITNMSSSEA